jgi:hypothetical protein
VTVEISPETTEIFERFIVCEYGYYTPKGEPLCWPVTPYWDGERGILAIATGLAYPNKALYAKRHPKVALFFSDARSSGLSGAPEVLVKGDATVLEDDLQENTDRYVREIRDKFPIARLALNPISVKFLDFYLPRLWVEIEPVSLRSRYDPTSAADGAVAVVRGPDGYPEMVRTATQRLSDDRLRLGVVPGEGPACLTFHSHSFGGVRLEAHMMRGEIEGDVFTVHKVVEFFGNGALFPLSVVGDIRRLRRRLRAELEARGEPMPKLRVPG